MPECVLKFVMFVMFVTTQRPEGTDGGGMSHIIQLQQRAQRAQDIAGAFPLLRPRENLGKRPLVESSRRWLLNTACFLEDLGRLALHSEC